MKRVILLVVTMLECSGAISSALGQSKEMQSTVRPAPTRLPHRESNVKSLWFFNSSDTLSKLLFASPVVMLVPLIVIDVN